MGRSSGTYLFTSGVIFGSVTIPQGATIDSAFIRVTAYDSDSDNTCNVLIQGYDYDNCPEPGDYATAAAMTKTTANVAWSAIAAWTDGNTYDTPDITSIIQEIVNRGSYGGDKLGIEFTYQSSDDGARRNFSSYDYLGAAEKAELHVTWHT